jgi:exosortase A-associated hydrolase 1
MRRSLTFLCEGSQCMASLDAVAGAATGLFVVSGGNEIRIGAHRGMATLAADIAAEGYSCFRFDRRGVGDSEGENGEFTNSAADLSAALVAFRAECPGLSRIIAFGNCDAATALLLHPPQGIAAMVVGNIWVIEKVDDLPPPAAIKARYLERIKDPKSWVRLFTGAINVKKLLGGLFKLARPSTPNSLADDVAAALSKVETPVTILLAERDATALAFEDVWNKPMCDAARMRQNIKVRRLDSASHSFANDDDYAALKSALITSLRR